nr:hypothetical protein [Tanacetum cinerariifolium]GEZ80126.1 hypothetical protein [Tanacetum cinerariifolium]
FVDPEIFTQVDGAQSSRVTVSLPEDPYEAIRQAYLVRMDTESEPFEDIIKTESPHIVAPPTCHVGELEGSGTSGARSMSSDSTAPLSPDHPLTHTTPALVLSLYRTARIAVHVLPAMSPSLSISIAEVAAMPDLAFRKRFRSSYNSSPSPTFPVQKRYRGTSELILDTDSEGEELGNEDDDEEEDGEVKESSDSDSESEDADDEGPTVEDGDPAVRDEGLAVRHKGPSMIVESLGLRGDETMPEASREGQIPSVFEIGQGYGSVPEPERPEGVSALRQPILTTWIDLEDGIVYIDVSAYPPPASPVQTPPLIELSFHHHEHIIRKKFRDMKNKRGLNKKQKGLIKEK